MEQDIYTNLPKLKIELNLISLVGSVLVVIFAFIIPISLIQNQPVQVNSIPNTTGQVAGASTSKEDSKILLPIINQRVSLEGQSGVLILLALVLIGFSSFIILFLIFDGLKKKQHNF